MWRSLLFVLAAVRLYMLPDKKMAHKTLELRKINLFALNWVLD